MPAMSLEFKGLCPLPSTLWELPPSCEEAQTSLLDNDTGGSVITVIPHESLSSDPLSADRGYKSKPSLDQGSLAYSHRTSQMTHGFINKSKSFLI